MPEILIVEDEPSIADALIYALESENFSVTHVATGQKGLDALQAKHELVILDIGLPDITGFDVCREIRKKSQIPILFLTARNSEIDQILGLELGADDYVTKPFSPRTLVARTRAILRRSIQAPPATALSASENKNLLHHNEVSMTVECLGQSLDLTAHEYKLLLCFLQHPTRVFTREQLLMKAWEDPYSVTDRTVDAHIKTLRSKIRQIAPSYDDPIQTRRGLGYVFQPIALS